MRTQRLVILVTPEEKQVISARAKALDISTSEAVRLAIKQFSPETGAKEAQLQVLTDELEKATARAKQSMKTARIALSETLDYFARKHRGGKRSAHGHN